MCDSNCLVTVTLKYHVLTSLQVSLVTQLFVGLRELCNLIIIQPEHIRGHCNSELVRTMQSHTPLAAAVVAPHFLLPPPSAQSSFDQQVVMNFVQLRADYRTAKINKLLQQ